MSNSIYDNSLSEKYHYVYQITEKSSNKKYIGVRTSEVSPEFDLGIFYFSSSSDMDFIKNQRNKPQDYIYEVLSIFDNRECANLEEERLHEINQVDSNPEYINRRKANGSFYNHDKVVVKDSEGNIFITDKNNPKYLNGEYVSFVKDMVAVKDSCGNNFIVNRTDPRYISGELIGVCTGKTVVVDERNQKYFVDKNDHRIQSGEFKHMNHGKVVVKDKNNSTYQLSVNDELYTSGVVQHINVGKILVVDKDGNVYSVYKDDARYVNGDLVAISKNRVVVRDTQGNVFATSINDPKYLNGEYTHINKGKISAKDIHGNTYSIYKNDPRYLTGELIGITGFWFMIENLTYTKKQAIEKYNITEQTLYRRCKSDNKKWSNWIIRK